MEKMNFIEFVLFLLCNFFIDKNYYYKGDNGWIVKYRKRNMWIIRKI